ncbi:MAG: reverse transcriptase domain-containing protein [Candidatus Nomurabacteria bacterium]|nr:reverse transcriptase domain-containing protein [Candidatus Nomurabacteria bacterium]
MDEEKKIINRELFIKIVSGIWGLVLKKTYVSIDEKIEKDFFLNSLFNEIQNSTFSPSNPREYIVSNKHNLVSRIVPVLSIKDICVYYFCLKILENNLAINRIDSTYGGFRMGGKIRKMEELDFESVNEVPFSISPYTFNPLAWVEAWRDFQRKAYVYSKQEEYSYFIKFDIANFYDCINLNLLEKKVRTTCNGDYSEVIDLLFHFLKNWNKKFDKYFPKSVGLAQDEVGDCSRILANFYLQDFDKVFSDYCITNNIQYLRYADDMLIMGKNQIHTKKALFFASKELSKIGLNINSSKVDCFNSLAEYNRYWAFDIFNKLGDKNSKFDIESAIEDYKFNLENNINFRKDSVLARILNCNLQIIDITKKQYILAQVLNDDFLVNCEEFALKRLYYILSESDKILLKEKLESLIDVTYFNKYHYVLLKLSNLFKFNETRLKLKIEELKF